MNCLCESATERVPAAKSPLDVQMTVLPEGNFKGVEMNCPSESATEQVPAAKSPLDVPKTVLPEGNFKGVEMNCISESATEQLPAAKSPLDVPKTVLPEGNFKGPDEQLQTSTEQQKSPLEEWQLIGDDDDDPEFYKYWDSKRIIKNLQDSSLFEQECVETLTHDQIRALKVEAQYLMEEMGNLAHEEKSSPKVVEAYSQLLKYHHLLVVQKLKSLRKTRENKVVTIIEEFGRDLGDELVKMARKDEIKTGSFSEQQMIDNFWEEFFSGAMFGIVLSVIFTLLFFVSYFRIS